MANQWRRIRKRASHARLAQDELIFEVATADVDAAARIIKTEMERALELTVPIEVTLKTGTTWYDVQSFEATEDELRPDV